MRVKHSFSFLLVSDSWYCFNLYTWQLRLIIIVVMLDHIHIKVFIQIPYEQESSIMDS